MDRILKYIVVSVFFLIGFAFTGNAQFKEEAFTQTYNDPADTTGMKDTTDKLFSVKEFIGGLAHKNTLKIGTMFAGSVVLPGTAQIYNKQYWKLPIIYGGIGALAGTGGYYFHKHKKSVKAYDSYLETKAIYENAHKVPYPYEAPAIDTRAKTTGTWLMVGAGLVYWGSLMDGVVSYKSDKSPHPGRATLYSALLPGLGQIYNGEYFKVPIYWGCLLGSTHFLVNNNTNYKRFKRIHNEATTDPNYTGSISGETAKWYRDEYRRYRDYSIVATALFYLLQVIDANVFAYMHDFEVTDDISINLEPAVIAPDNMYAMQSSSYMGQSAVGMRLGIRF
jgi:hypothetical protein